MSNNLIATTPQASVQPLAFKGIVVYGSFPQLRDMLLHAFGEDHARLFARPLDNAATEEIDWYAQQPGQAVQLSTLSPESRAPLLERISSMGAQINAYAQELIASGDSLKITRGHILKLALDYPDDNCLYAIGDQPILICWGCNPGTPGVEGKSISRLIQDNRPVPPPEVSGPAAPLTPEPVAAKAAPVVLKQTRRFGFPWLWLLCLLPLALLFLLLFASFGALPALSGQTLLKIPLFNTDQLARSELARLDREIATQKQALADHAARCVPDKNPEPEPAKPREREALVIPEDAPDASFLAGQWVCETGLANSRTRRPVEVHFSFDDTGHGQATIFEQDDRCTGEASAALQDGLLQVTLGSLACANSGTHYSPMSIECKNSQTGSAQCFGKNRDGSVWDAMFLRRSAAGAMKQ